MTGATESPSGIEVVFVGYFCRSCGSSKQVGVRPRIINGDRHLCPVNHRLYHGRCDECNTRRVHVLDVPGVGQATGEPPIDQLAYEGGDRDE